MSNSTSTTGTVSLVKPAKDQAAALKAHAGTVLASSDADLRTFKSGNSGLYISNTLKASAARELGLVVPPGGKLKVQVTVIVVDPENSDS